MEGHPNSHLLSVYITTDSYNWEPTQAWWCLLNDSLRWEKREETKDIYQHFSSGSSANTKTVTRFNYLLFYFSYSRLLPLLNLIRFMSLDTFKLSGNLDLS